MQLTSFTRLKDRLHHYQQLQLKTGNTNICTIIFTNVSKDLYSVLNFTLFKDKIDVLTIRDRDKRVVTFSINLTDIREWLILEDNLTTKVLYGV